MCGLHIGWLLLLLLLLLLWAVGMVSSNVRRVHKRSILFKSVVKSVDRGLLKIPRFMGSRRVFPIRLLYRLLPWGRWVGITLVVTATHLAAVGVVNPWVRVPIRVIVIILMRVRIHLPRSPVIQSIVGIRVMFIRPLIVAVPVSVWCSTARPLSVVIIVWVIVWVLVCILPSSLVSVGVLTVVVVVMLPLSRVVGLSRGSPRSTLVPCECSTVRV